MLVIRNKFLLLFPPEYSDKKVLYARSAVLSNLYFIFNIPTEFFSSYNLVLSADNLPWQF